MYVYPQCMFWWFKKQSMFNLNLNRNNYTLHVLQWPLPWHRLQGSRTVNLTEPGTLSSMYVLIAKSPLSAVVRVHVPYISRWHLWPWLVFSVRHSSDTAFLRILHVSSTKLFSELNWLILKLFRQPCRCSGMCLKCEASARVEFSCFIQHGVAWRWKG